MFTVKPILLVPLSDIQIQSFGDSAKLVCEMSGEPKPRITWIKDAEKIFPQHSSRMAFLPDGSLRISSVQNEDLGQYECLGQNVAGETKSNPARIMMASQTQLLNSPFTNSSRITVKPSNIIAPVDADSFTLACSTEGMFEPKIHWYFNGRLVKQSRDKTQILTNGSLVIKRPTLLDAGTYKCEAANNLESIQATSIVEIKGTFFKSLM